MTVWLRVPPSPRCGDIEYEESGSGPTLVLAPGSCSTGAAWRAIVSRWGERFRCVTTSLLGYGRTAERRGPEDCDISLEAEALEQVVERAGCPVHLVGHSFGGAVALAVALRRRVPVLSLTLIEVPAATLLPPLGELEHYRAFRRMTDEYFGAFHAGDRSAIRSMIDFYGGPGTFDAWPERVRRHAIETTPVNLLDWSTLFGFDLHPALLSGIEMPALVLWGSASHPAVQRANHLLSQCLPRGSAAVIAGAAHFMIATHAEEVATVVARHVTG